MKKGLLLLFLLSLAFTNGNAQTIHSIPIIDSHCHIKTQPNEPFLTVDEYFANNNNLDIKYLFGLTVAQKGNIEKTRMSNDSLFSMSQRYPKFVPVYSVHPLDGDEALEELDRISQMGGKIIKLHPISQSFSILNRQVIDLTRAAGEKNLIVLMDGYGFVTPNYLENLLQLALINHDTKFIIAHMGGSDFHKLGALKAVTDLNPGMFGNVWYDLSVTVHIYAGSPYQEQFEWVLRQIGTDRVLFGSDDPAVSPQQALEAFYKLNLTDEEKHAILYKNAMLLLNLD